MNQDLRACPSLQAAAICQTDLLSIELGASLCQAIRLMASRHVGSVLVERQGQVLGLLTRRQAMRLRLEGSASQPLTEAMLQPLLRIDADMDLDALGLEMVSRDRHHALVYAADGRCLGIVSQSDLVNHQGLEHDLFLKPLIDITNVQVLRLSGEVSLRQAIERLHAARHSALLTGGDDDWRIMTETDVMRLMAAEVELDQPLAALALARLVSVDSGASLFTVRQLFKQHGFRHLGVQDAQGRVIGLVSYADILRSVEKDYVYRLRELLHDRSRELRQSQHALHLIERIIHASHEAILITDARGTIQSVNPAFTAITGYQAQDAIGRNPSMLSSGRHDARFYQSLWQALARDGHWQGEIWNRRKDGRIYPEWLSITAIENEQGEVCQYAAIFHDLTELKRSEQRLQQLSRFDAVTGLANRRLFEERLQLACSYGREQQRMVALLALDLDLFSQINDRFGHQGGDRLLKLVAERIETTLGDRGTAARPAGDEFFIIVTELAGAAQLNALLDELTRVLSMPYWLEHAKVRLHASIGVAVAPEDAETSEALIRCAEVALQHSKQRGRNTISFFSTRLHEQTLSRYRIAGLLHEALERGEFQMVYQPQIAVDSGRLLGVEALIRWHSPQLGPVSPEVFIPVAEDAGLIEAVGQWVLERAVQDAVGWSARGLPLKLAVNFSAREFQRGDVAARVLSVLDRYQLPAEQFVVELTETSFMHSVEATEAALAQLRAAGVRIAIDDFGTGFSSLSYIRNLSLDLIKIDRSFLTDLGQSDHDRRLVQAMVDMGHAMALQVVAEGVETAADLAVLQALGCDQAQGYHIARPMPADQFEHWAGRYRPA